ncbi:hypothetical protein K438DRAFT_1974388 [Mycena galopus ATCC 62051]|nr:hypothetical protein K438DRAFT_1974388 [Mycena galopus ATCC 62051]
MVNHRKHLPRKPKHLPAGKTLRSRRDVTIMRRRSHPQSALPQTQRPSPPRPLPCRRRRSDTFSIQPHTHNVAVELKHGGTISRFRIFFRRHKLMPRNGFFDVKGDVLVMRTAVADHQSVVNMRSSDRPLINFILTELSPNLRAFQGPDKTTLPEEFKLTLR